jgi:TolA-binding protein
MLLDEHYPNQGDNAEHDLTGRAVTVEDRSGLNGLDDLDSPLDFKSSAPAQARTADGNHVVTNHAVETSAVLGGGNKTRKLGTRWWILAAGSALLLTILTLAAVYLLTKKPSTVDQIIILTVPSGAEIMLDSKPYGQSPVKLEQLAIGTYTLTITKDNYEPIIQPITISEPSSFDFKLKLLPPPESSNLSPEERVRLYEQQSQDAFNRGNYGLGYERTALYFADLILELDSGNQFAQEMRERVQKIEHQAAQEASASKDLGKAQEIYNFLVDHYPEDKEARVELAKLDNQLASRKGEIRDLVRKAEEALQAGNLIEPGRTSAYYYARLALAIDHQNAQARAVSDQVRDTIAMRIEDAYRRGDVDSAINQVEKAIQLFQNDKQLRARQRELIAARAAEAGKASDVNNRRVEGLANYRHGNFAEAIPDLEAAITNGRGTPDVIFAVAHSYMKIGQYDKAAYYFRQVRRSDDDAYRSAIAALGDIAREHGDTATALERYKEAKQLGGSTLYSVATLEDKIEKIEKKQRDKASEPIPITIRVKHIHGGFMGGSCSGTLTINSTGVRYDGTEHTYSSNLVAVGVRVTKDEMTVRFQDKSEKFKVARPEADHFSETLSRFQQSYAPINK